MMKDTKGFEKETVRGRDRYYFNGELVGLQCTFCKKELDLSEFSKLKTGFVGLDSKCKKCNYKRGLKWKKENKKVHYTHKQKWRSQNKIHLVAYNQNARAKENDNRGNLAKVDLEILLNKATENGAYYCMVTGEVIEKTYFGHVVAVDAPLGHSTIENLIVLSHRANVTQGSQDLYSFLLTEKGQEIADKETVKDTIYWLAKLKNMSKIELLSESLEINEVAQFQKLYLEDSEKRNWITGGVQ